jgi:uncharacterized circularly permuted ATP-grasp superfamily protein/uncharacterized alpha-E superfamily protein
MTLADPGRDGVPGIVDGYRAAHLAGPAGPPAGPVLAGSAGPAVSGSDEWLGPDGVIRAGWQDLAATVDLLGVAGMQARGAQVRRLLEDDGVTYGVPAGADQPAGLWRLDPLPLIIGNQEWAELSAGLIQRAELLDRLQADLYGPRDLLRRGLIPPELVLGHAGFLRQCDGIRLPGPNQLLMASTDLVRQPDGWCALGDRTQAPSGAGYAMENRRIVSRVMPGLYAGTLLERLRSFFHTLRAALQEVAPSTAEAPRVVILTPGATSETAFDQAFLSTLLGFPLVEGQDLTVRGGRVWLRTLGRPQPVDVVLRRVDGWFCDPLQLRADSRLGVPGLLQAARAGNVSIVNPPGAGVLENPGLAPYLPALCQALLDEPLRLPPVATWWCGDPVARSHVLGNLATLVIRPIARGVGRANRFGWQLSRAELAELTARIEAEPHAWCAQQALEMSTTPVVTGSGLEPRRMVLRSFAVAAGGSFQLMSGGLARVAAQAGSLDISSQGGALAKDVWVIGRTAPASGPQAGPAGGPAELTRGPAADDIEPVVAAGLSSRVAEDMFWLGRYAERAEDAARLLRVAVDLVNDHSLRPGSVGADSLAVMLTAVTAVTTTYPGFVGDGSAGMIAAPQPELVRLAVDPLAPGTLAHAVRHTLQSAQAVREQLSNDTWLVIGSLDRQLLELGWSPEPELHLQRTLSRVLEGLLAFSGLAMESMVRDAGWYVMDAGRRIERALQLLALLRATLIERRPAAVDDLVMESVLISAESVITHRRRNPGRPRPADLLALLLFDRGNPRGVRHQLEQLADDLQRLPQTSDPALDPSTRLRAVQAWLREADLHELVRVDPAAGSAAGLGSRPRLTEFLDRLSLELTGLAESVARTHFARVVPPKPMPGAPTVGVR